MNIGAADDRHRVDLTRAHAFERQTEGVVGVEMRKVYSIEELLQLFRLGTGRRGLLKLAKTQDADQTLLVEYGPRGGFA